LFLGGKTISQADRQVGHATHGPQAHPSLIPRDFRKEGQKISGWDISQFQKSDLTYLLFLSQICNHERRDQICCV
ncbi:MAG: hypothetical protein AAFP92_26595, partial [Bacteroidota bacterium]